MSDEKPSGTLCTTLTELEASPPFVGEDKGPAFDLRGYQLIEPLGQGGMGEVYRSCDPALSRDLAIKVIKTEFHNHSAVERRFLREARITGSLQHPGIIPVYNLGRLADDRLFYTMRLLRDGRTFADILKPEAGKPERLPSLLAIFEKVCEAVAYAHSKRVIHRDLKPANIMVGKFGEVQVMDWGLAKLLTPEGEAADEGRRLEAGSTLIHTEAMDTPSDLTRAGSGIGTPAYMPPEQAQGDWELVDERADVFALGAILCVILTGQPPYSGGDGNEILRRARRGDVAEALARLEQCGADAALTALCRECLTPEREGRPRHAGIVAERVAAYEAEIQERLRRAERKRAMVRGVGLGRRMGCLYILLCAIAVNALPKYLFLTIFLAFIAILILNHRLQLQYPAIMLDMLNRICLSNVPLRWAERTLERIFFHRWVLWTVGSTLAIGLPLALAGVAADRIGLVAIGYLLSLPFQLWVALLVVLGTVLAPWFVVRLVVQITTFAVAHFDPEGLGKRLIERGAFSD